MVWYFDLPRTAYAVRITYKGEESSRAIMFESLAAAKTHRELALREGRLLGEERDAKLYRVLFEEVPG